MRKNLAVLVSGTGTNLKALLDEEPLLPAPGLGGDIQVVASDRDGVGALDLASQAGIDTVVVRPSDYGDRESWSQALVQALEPYEPDLVVLAGFMRILPASFVSRWPVLNVHPSLLPAFPGANAVEEALDWGVRLTGCTVHFVDEQVDHGPIVAQEAVPVLPGDTPETLHERIKAVEHRLLPECVALFCHDALRVDGRHVRIDK